MTRDDNRVATIAFVAPFLTFVGIMAIEKSLGIPPAVAYPVRFFATCLCVWFASRKYLSFRPSALLASIGLGVAVFLIWVGPDLLFAYRHFILFENSVMGKAESSIPVDLQQTLWFMALRVISATLLVPVVEELFWRGWLMRWLIDANFLRVPLGTYRASAFWISALLFASEHGPYWEVGLAAGVIYNAWIIRTRNLADCMLAHAVTNGILCGYVLLSGHWEYLL